MAAKNQLIIDMGDVKLTDKQMKSLQKAIHKAVAQKVKNAKPVAAKPAEDKPVAAGGPPLTAKSEVAGKTATLQVDFNNVDAGLSNFTATHNGDSKTITASDSISFNNVKPGESIVISGSGAGSKTVTISGVNALPMQMNFAEGQHVNGIFLILE